MNKRKLMLKNHIENKCKLFLEWANEHGYNNGGRNINGEYRWYKLFREKSYTTEELYNLFDREYMLKLQTENK